MWPLPVMASSHSFESARRPISEMPSVTIKLLQLFRQRSSPFRNQSQSPHQALGRSHTTARGQNQSGGIGNCWLKMSFKLFSNTKGYKSFKHPGLSATVKVQVDCGEWYWHFASSYSPSVFAFMLSSKLLQPPNNSVPGLLSIWLKSCPGFSRSAGKLFSG